MIPKIIHQIWFQDSNKSKIFSNKIEFNYNKIIKSNIPFELKYDMISIIAKNPKYYYLLWNENLIKKFLIKNYPNIYLLYKNLEFMIQKIDLAKYIILYHFGGIVVDVDVKAIKSFDYFFKLFKNDGIYFSKMPKFNDLEKFATQLVYKFEMNYDYINNGIIISRPNHPILMDFVNNISINKQTNNDCFYMAKVFNITGPAMVTNTIYSNKLKYNDLFILNNIYFEPCYGKDITCNIGNNTICFHKHKSVWISNWHNKMNILLKFIFNNLFSLIVDSASFIYFVFLRGFKIIYLIIILYFLINNFKSKKYT